MSDQRRIPAARRQAKRRARLAFEDCRLRIGKTEPAKRITLRIEVPTVHIHAAVVLEQKDRGS